MSNGPSISSLELGICGNAAFLSVSCVRTPAALGGGGGLRAQDGSVRGQEGESHGLAFVLILQQEKGNEATLASLGWMWRTRPAIHNLKI